MMMPAVEVRTFACTIAAGTAQATPAKVSMAMPSRVVTRVRVRVPPGPRGVVGFALAVSGEHVIPWGRTAWLVADDEVIEWSLADAPTTGDWSLIGYNTGQLDHTIYVSFDLLPITGRGSTLTAPLTITA